MTRIVYSGPRADLRRLGAPPRPFLAHERDVRGHLDTTGPRLLEPAAVQSAALAVASRIAIGSSTKSKHENTSSSRTFRSLRSTPSGAANASWKSAAASGPTRSISRARERVTAVDLSSRSIELARERAKVFGVDDRIDFCRGQRRAIVRVRASRRIRPGVFVRRHSPFSASGARARGDPSSLRGTPYDVEADGDYWWSWKVFGILLTDAHGAFWRLPDAVARNSEAQTGCPVTYTYTKPSLTQMLGRHGFAVDEMFVDHIFPYRVADYVEYRYVKTLPFRWLPDRVMRALESRLGWHLCVTAHGADAPVAR